MKTKRKLSFKSQLFRSYVIILILPVVTNLCMYVYFLKNIEYQERERCNGLMEQSMVELDNYIRELSFVVDLVRGTQSYQSLTEQTLSDADRIVQEHDLGRDIGAIKVAHPAVEEVMVYLRKNNTLVSQGNVLQDVEGAYPIFIEVEGMDYSQFEQNVLQKEGYLVANSSSIVKLNFDQEKNRILFTCTLPLNRAVIPEATVILVLQEERFMECFHDFSMYKSVKIELADHQGTRIVMEEPDAEGKVRFEGRAQQSGWTAAVYLEYSDIVKDVSSLKILSGLILLTCLIITFFMVLFLTANNIRPIHNLIQRFEPPGALRENNEFVLLSAILDKAAINEVAFGNYIDENREVIRQGFIKQLMTGQIADSGDIDENRKRLNLKLEGNRFTAILVALSERHKDFMEAQSIRLVLLRYLDSCENLEAADGEFGEIVILFAFSSIDDTKNMYHIENTVGALVGLFRPDYGGYLKVAVGPFCDNLPEISASYFEAKRISQEGMVTQNNRVLWMTAHVATENWYYPLHVETKIINSMKAGKTENFRELFRLLEYENFHNRVLSSEQLENLGLEMRGTITKCIAEKSLSGENMLILLEKLTSINWRTFTYEEFDRTCAAMLFYAEHVEMDVSDNISPKIRLFIEEKYANPSLNRSMLADYLGVNDAYTSTLFKNHMGDTFYRYLENYRLAKAVELLKDEKLTVEDIARQIGYTSSASFRRAFKKNMGCSPGEYRVSGPS